VHELDNFLEIGLVELIRQDRSPRLGNLIRSHDLPLESMRGILAVCLIGFTHPAGPCNVRSSDATTICNSFAGQNVLYSPRGLILASGARTIILKSRQTAQNGGNSAGYAAETSIFCHGFGTLSSLCPRRMRESAGGAKFSCNNACERLNLSGERDNSVFFSHLQALWGHNGCEECNKPGFGRHCQPGRTGLARTPGRTEETREYTGRDGLPRG